MMAPTLRPYQVDQLDAIVGGLANGNNRLLIKSPTGTGKTVMFAALLKHPPIATWLRSFGTRRERMLIIAHREELLDQAAQKIHAANPGLLVAVEQGERRASRHADVIIASIQSLAARQFVRLRHLLDLGPFRIVVVDEAHHAAARTYRTALAHLGFLPPETRDTDEDNIEAATFDDVAKMELALKDWDTQAPKDRLLVGVTATPNRSDAIGLNCVFQTLAYSYDLRQAIDDGWLVPMEPWSIETTTSLDDVHVQRGEFNQRELADTVNNERRNELAVAAWTEHAGGAPTLAFTVDVAHAHALADAFAAAGYRAAAVSGETPKDERRALLESFQAGGLDVLANCMVLTEGTDLPRAACILHAKPTKSATLYEQMTGRGLRLFPGKDACVVIDLVDMANRHSLVNAPVLYGLPPGLLSKGDRLDRVAEQIDELTTKRPGILEHLDGKRMTLAQLQATATAYDIWKMPELGVFGEGRSMNWIRVSDDVYRLRYPWAEGYETLQVSKDLLGKWEIVATWRMPALKGPPLPARQRTLASGILFVTEAGRLAEQFVHSDRAQVTRLKDRDAPWRARPASDKQIAFLRRLRVPVPPNCTMGQASDLIDLANAKKGRL